METVTEGRLGAAARQHPFVTASGVAAVLTLFADTVVGMLFVGNALDETGFVFSLFAAVGTAWLVSALLVRLVDGLDVVTADRRPTPLVAGITLVELLAAVSVLSPLYLSGRRRVLVLLVGGVVLALASLSRASLVFFETDHPQWTGDAFGSGASLSHSPTTGDAGERTDAGGHSDSGAGSG